MGAAKNQTCGCSGFDIRGASILRMRIDQSHRSEQHCHNFFGGGGFGGQGGGFGPFGFHGFGGQQVHMDQEEIMDLFEGMFGGGRVNRGRGRDVQQAITIDFLEAVNGCTKDINVEYNDKKSNNQRVKKKKTVKVKTTL